MTTIIVRHKVENFAKWKETFDNVLDFRKEKGEQSFQLYQTTENPNEVIGVFNWDTDENAKAFFESEDLKKKMQEAGVAGEPNISFVNEVSYQ